MTILDAPQNPINESTVPMQPVIVKWGLISAAVSIIFQLITTMSGMGGMTMVISTLSIGVSIYILILAVRADRDEQLGGYASFKRVFILTLAIILLSALVAQVFNFLYMNYLNPSAADTILETTRSFMEKMNLPEEDVDKAIEKAAQDLKSPMNIIKTMAVMLVGGAIIAAIYGAAMKKERPMFN